MSAIKTFSEFINESIWSDIQDRSSGDTVRKEDDVNLLDRDEFYDYLKNKYNKISHLISEDPSEIHIKLGWSYFPQRDYKIDIHWVEKNKIKNLYLNFGPCELDTLCNKKFKTGTANDGISNKEILNIIDFCLDYISSHKEIESPINESIWSDIQDRSSGDTIRKEDDINLMSIEDFCAYLNDNYISEDGYRTYRIYYVSKVLSIAVLVDGPASFYSIKYDYEHNMIYLNDEIEDFVPELCQKLKNNFKVVKKRVGSIYTKFIISPSDGSECTNRFFVDVLDFIIENGDKEKVILAKQNLNESIWSDIQDRSSGDTIRKEDDINLLDRDGLYDYIYDVYKQIAMKPLPLKSSTSPTHTYFSIPIFRTNNIAYRLSCIFDNDKISNISLRASDADVKDFKQALIDNFDITIGEYGSLTITAKDGTVSNQVCMDLIKTIVENAPHPYLKKREN